MSAAGGETAAPIRLEPRPRVLLVIAPYYREIADMQIAGARAALQHADVASIEVPGALEIPTAIALAAQSRRYDGYVALGCVIRGETTHYQTVCEESARGLTWLGTMRGLCIGNGVLTVENEAQAIARADPAQMDKGGGAAAACLRLIGLARQFAPPSGFHPADDHIMLA